MARSELPLLTRYPISFCRKYAWPTAILIIGAVLDALTTIEFMMHLGPDAEFHPAMMIVATIL